MDLNTTTIFNCCIKMIKDCPKCRVYIYDVLHRPFPFWHPFHGFYNLAVTFRLLDELVPEFQRIASDHHWEVFDCPSRDRCMYLAVRCLEAGLVRRVGITQQKTLELSKPQYMALYWVTYQFKQMKEIQQIHFEHSGGYLMPENLPLSPEMIFKNEMRLAAILSSKMNEQDDNL
jgi:hypothetical protein